MTKEQGTTLLVTRHGLVDNPEDILYYRHVNVPLSAEGHVQMRRVGESIKNHGFIPSCIYTSVLLRAVESSEEIAKSFPGIEIIGQEDLQDPYAPGIQTKTNSWMAEIEEQGHDVYSHPDLADVIEPKDEVRKRMKGVVDEIIRKHTGETIVVVSHGDTTAFLKEEMRHPGEQLPSVAKLKKSGRYPNKGEVWCVVLDPSGRILEENVIG